MTRYEIGARVPVGDVRIGDWLGEHKVRDIHHYDSADYPEDYPDEDFIYVTVVTTGGRFPAISYRETMVVPATHSVDAVIERPGGLRIRFTCTASRGNPCRRVCASCGHCGELCGCDVYSTDSGTCQLTAQANHADLESLLRAYDGNTRPDLRSGAVLMTPTPAGRFLWRYVPIAAPAAAAQQARS